MNGLPSSRCCRTSRVAFLGYTTDVSSTASSGSCDLGHPGAICRIILALTRPAITVSSAGGGLVSGAASWTHLPLAHDAAVQMIDTSIVRVHQHGACITRQTIAIDHRMNFARQAAAGPSHRLALVSKRKPKLGALRIPLSG